MSGLNFRWDGDINITNGDFIKDGIPIGTSSSGATLEAIKSNYIDNSNFSVNSNGQTEYTTEQGTNLYTVDRWYIDGGTLIPKNNGVQFTNNNENTGTNSLIRLRQDIPYSFSTFAGKTLTLSAKINGVIYTGASEQLPAEKPTEGTNGSSAIQYIQTEGVAEHAICLNYSVTGDYFVPYIALAYSQSVEIEWMKLEIGDSATPYVAPDYATEKIKTSFMSDNGNISMPYTEEEIDTKVEGIEEQIDGINSTSLTVKVNDKEFVRESGALFYETFNIVNNVQGGYQGRIIEIDGYYFVNEYNNIRCYKGITALTENNPLYNITFIDNTGLPLNQINQVAIIRSVHRNVYQIYLVNQTSVYGGTFSIEDLPNQIPVNSLNITIDADNGRLVHSREKAYILPNQEENILVFPNGTDYFTGKELTLFGDNQAIDIECTMDDNLFVYSSAIDSWGWCDQAEDGALVFGMCRIEEGTMAEPYPIRKIFQWGKYIIGQTSYEYSDGSYYYWTFGDNTEDNVMVDADLRGEPMEQYPGIWVDAKRLPIPVPDSSSLSVWTMNAIGVSKNYLVISGTDFTGIYRDIISPNYEKLELGGSRFVPIYGIIENTDYLFISSANRQVRIPYRTYEISLEEAINRLG